ncbi:MAG: Hint domain-containing protein [Flavobacterium sp.]|nr:Hint domain-containing protein [Flavobacterium sp.]
MWKDYTYKNLLDGKPPCFLAGTLVKTENGLCEIEKIEKDTKVLSYNFDSKKTEYQQVLQTFSNFAEKYVVIHTETEVLKVTGAHLFYVHNENKWLAASQLKVDMHLVDDNQNLVAIKKLEIIKAEVPTYNLEVAKNHNYYVGETQHILTHNDGKKLKFMNTEMFDFRFYEFLDLNDKPLYVGQTTQGYDVRISQHFKDYEKFPEKKPFVEFENPKQIIVNGQKPPYKMTPFEAAVTEMHELQTRGGKRIDGKGLFNKKYPVSKITFDRIKKDFPNFNPCRFYY